MMMYEREDINEILLNNVRAMLHLNEKKMAAKIENWKKRKREKKRQNDGRTRRRCRPQGDLSVSVSTTCSSSFA